MKAGERVAQSLDVIFTAKAQNGSEGSGYLDVKEDRGLQSDLLKPETSRDWGWEGGILKGRGRCCLGLGGRDERPGRAQSPVPRAPGRGQGEGR